MSSVGVSGMTFSWSCTRSVSQTACFTAGVLATSSAVLTIPSASLVLTAGDDYVFAVTATKGSRTASASVTIETSALPVPTVAVQPVSAFITVDTRVVLRGTAIPTCTLT